MGDDSVCLFLGDNIFYGQGLSGILHRATGLDENAVVFAYCVNNSDQYGVMDFDSEGKALSIVEKPEKPRSNFAIPGIYFYDNTVLSMAAELKPSLRGELEITDIHWKNLEQGRLNVEVMGRGIA